MKKFFIVLTLFFLANQLFARDLTALERRIIMAGPEEMIQMVKDRSLEKELFNIYNYVENLDSDEIMDTFLQAFPGITEDECLFIIIKLALVVSLGSGDEEGIEMGLDILEFCEEVEYMAESEYLPEDIQAFVDSSYWKDCLAFYKMFDPESFLKERFPDYF